LFLTLLKPIVKVPKIIVVFPTLLELVKLAETIIAFWEIICSIFRFVLRFIGVGYRCV
jgi:hypothetical protein